MIRGWTSGRYREAGIQEIWLIHEPRGVVLVDRRKVVSERLAHSSVAFTLDTYAHVMPGTQPDAPELFIRLAFNGNDGNRMPAADADEAPPETPEQDADATLGDDE